MHVLTTRGYKHCEGHANYRFLNHLKESIHFQLHDADTVSIEFINGTEVKVPAELLVMTSEGTVLASEVKFGDKLLIHRQPGNLDKLAQIMQEGKRRHLNEDAWYVDLKMPKDKALELYRSTGHCLKLKKSPHGFVVSVPSDVINLISDEPNIDRERDPFEVVKSASKKKERTLKVTGQIDAWSQVVIDGLICEPNLL